jgi:hypothetical protein
MISRRRDRNQNQGHGQGINLVTNLADAVDGDSVGRRAAAYPVTPDEISKMWHEAAKRGPHPDMQRCADLAAYISRLMPEFRRQVQVWRTPGRALPPNAFWSPAERNELRDAINQLRRAADDRVPSLNQDIKVTATLNKAKAGLDALEAILCGAPSARGHKQWHAIGYVVAEQARLTWVDIGGRANRVSRNGVVAEFSRLVLRRLGFNVTATAIADHHARKHACHKQ